MGISAEDKGYYKNLLTRSILQGMRTGAVAGGIAGGCLAVTAAWHFIPHALLASNFFGPGAFICLQALIFAAGTIPGAIAGAVAGVTLTPFYMAFNAITQKRVPTESVAYTKDHLDKLKKMPDELIKVVINDIIARYSQSKSLSASHSSKKLLKELQEFSHVQTKLTAIENYLNEERNGVPLHNGKKLFRIINETLTTTDFDKLKQHISSDVRTAANDDELTCPLKGKNKLIQTPQAIYCIKHDNPAEGQVMVVDETNFKDKRKLFAQADIFRHQGELWAIQKSIPEDKTQTATTLVNKALTNLKGYFASLGQRLGDWLASFFTNNNTVGVVPGIFHRAPSQQTDGNSTSKVAPTA